MNTLSQVPLALYAVDQAVPEVRTDWDEDDAGTPAAVQGAVVSVTRMPTGETRVILSTGDDGQVAVCWSDPSPNLTPGEQILALGMVRPRCGEIVLTALSAPVRTGRIAPMQPPVATPVPAPASETEDNAVLEAPPEESPLETTTEQTDLSAATEADSLTPPPQRDEVLTVMSDVHDREPWGVTWSIQDGHVAVVYTQQDNDEARDAVMARWRQTLRKAGHRVLVRRDLMPLGRQGPTLGPWWLHLTPGPDPLAPDDDDSPFSEEEARAHITAIAHYRARLDLQ